MAAFSGSWETGDEGWVSFPFGEQGSLFFEGEPSGDPIQRMSADGLWVFPRTGNYNVSFRRQGRWPSTLGFPLPSVSERTIIKLSLWAAIRGIHEDDRPNDIIGVDTSISLMAYDDPNSQQVIYGNIIANGHNNFSNIAKIYNYCEMELIVPEGVPRAFLMFGYFANAAYELHIDDWEITLTQSTSTFTKDGNVWKPSDKYVKDNGIWKPAETSVRHNGIWKDV